MFPVRVPRHACSPRDHARAGDVWRLIQDVAVSASVVGGWPPERYRAEGTGFVVRQMSAVHLREVRHCEELDGRTQIADVRRGVLLRRETWLGDAVRASVQWVHIGRSGAPERAPDSLLSAFGVHPEPPVELPGCEPIQPVPLPEFRLSPWWTEMDPMGHVNHPRYLDWVDEALCRYVSARGGDPVAMVAVAETLNFRGGARVGQDIVVQVEQVGSADGAGVFETEIFAGSELVCSGRVWRRLPAIASRGQVG